MNGRTKHFVLFFIGFVVLVSAVIVGMGAIKHEFELVSSTDQPDNWDTPLANYDELSSGDQEVVRGAIDGKRYVYDSKSELPVESAMGSRVMVFYQDQYYIFSKGTFFDSGSTTGMAAIVLGVIGVLLMAEAIRRQHFPHVRLRSNPS